VVHGALELEAILCAQFKILAERLLLCFTFPAQLHGDQQIALVSPEASQG